MKYTSDYLAYIADDGNYGVDNVLTFDIDEFVTKYPDAWDLIDDIADSERYTFVLAVLDQDEVILKEFAEELGINIRKLLV